jgi:3-deoxy-7-phosphoheptulonate synthase
MQLPSSQELKQEFPLSARALSFIQKSRDTAKRILLREDLRLVAIFGPCSIHDPTALFEFAEKFQTLQPKIEESLFPILRFFVEKPRSWAGWKGLLYDPHLDGSNDIEQGLRLSRKLLVDLAEREIPCATELLDPLAIPYFDDLIVWGMVGARTSASQPHRQVASGLPFPVGFKNGTQGEISSAVMGLSAARLPHSHIGINPLGRIASLQTQGNPFTHLVLRGSEKKGNYDPDSVHEAMKTLQMYKIEPRLLIDCSHGNSGKDPSKQSIALQSTLEQVKKGNGGIAGFMLESHLFGGKQSLEGELEYGVSITDPCLSWEETEQLLIRAANFLQFAKGM